MIARVGHAIRVGFCAARSPEPLAVEPTELPWSDEPNLRWNQEAHRTLSARVFPSFDEKAKIVPKAINDAEKAIKIADKATEIVLEGPCPRCHHQMASTHPIRAVISEEAARTLAKAEDVAPSPRYRVRRITAECRCRHTHTDTPDGEHGCGVPFALWVRWSIPQNGGLGWAVDVDPSTSEPTPLHLHDERELMASAETQLADVRKAAESWRNGLAGLLAVLLAVFFIKGKDSFDDISDKGLKATLATLLLISAGLALFGAYMAIRAAFGTPRDAQLGEIPRLAERLPATTPRYIHKYGTLSAWRHALARRAVADLRLAKVATIGSLLAITAAAGISWFA